MFCMRFKRQIETPYPPDPLAAVAARCDVAEECELGSGLFTWFAGQLSIGQLSMGANGRQSGRQRQCQLFFLRRMSRLAS